MVAIKNGKMIRSLPITSKCRTDASLQGYGCYDLDTNVHSQGRWSSQESESIINYLELLRIKFTIQSLYNHVSNAYSEV